MIKLFNLLPWLAAGACLSACQGSPQRPTATDSMDNGAQPLGSLSEAAFAALHELDQATPPAAVGRMVELAPGLAPAYLSPAQGLASGAQAPVVLVIHEWWGLNANIRHWADRLAQEGYTALALDLYGGQIAANADEAMALMRAVDAAQAEQVVRAGDAYARTVLKAPRTASIGWCFGGHWSLRCALLLKDLDGAVIYYGKLESDPEKLKAIQARILGIFGDQDKSITPADVEAFERGLEAAQVPHRILSYAADHAFANPSGQRYNSEAASSAWDETRAFLRDVLQPGK
jgi:carboxymethylenebutenolidase